MRVLAPLCCALHCVAVLWAGAHAHAQVYEWVDEQGTVARSDTLPPETLPLRELRVVEGTAALTALEQRTLQIINEARRASLPSPSLPAQTPWGASMLGYSVEREQPLAAAAASPASENVRDPCLLSWDPKCHEKHAGDYDPRWGYAPSVLRARADTAAQQPMALSTPVNQ